MQQILFMSMDKRLAVFLWDEISKTDDDTVHLTHEQVARDVGSAREVVSRMLKYFSSEGIVELSRGGIKVLDRKKLRKLAE
jgi:CRP/FNR family transcriptional regulator